MARARPFVIATAALVVMSLAGPASASGLIDNDKFWDEITPGADKTYIDSYCTLNGSICGAVIFYNLGGFVVKSVDLHAHTSQKNDASINANCAGTAKKFSSNVNLGQYDTFIVPASCNYALKINIQSGPKKSRDVFLTENCVVQTSVEGTVMSNSWSNSVDWVPDTKPTGASGRPTDADGNQCKVS